MVFSSLPFVYFFLPCVFLFYYLIPATVWKNSVLLVFSLLFYSWGEPKNIILMLLTAAVAWLGGLLIHSFDAQGRPGRKKLAFVFTTVLVVSNLFVFKYLDFAITNINILFGTSIPLAGILLPIGISFYTFQILSYVFDLYLGRVELQRNYFWFLLYVSFFPQLIAGPIVRYRTVEREIRFRRETVEEIGEGLRRFILGLAKKLILANTLGSISETIYAGDTMVFGTAAYWLAAYAYTLQIYFDFSAYSDMAIGLGRMFGFHFLENFDYPYVSRSVTEFWRRWHISLSSWFRDYIYIPLGGNRVSKRRWMFNIFAVWGLTGLWHGASWNFVLWGLYYALILLAEKLLLAPLLEKLPGALRWIYTMFMVIMGWVLFNLTETAQLIFALQTMFVPRYTNWTVLLQQHARLVMAFLIVPLGTVCMLPWKKRISIGDGLSADIISYGIHGILLVVCIIIMVSSTYNPFIYFRF